MLTKGNHGKYLTKEWNEKRQKALIDKADFTADELTWLEITDSDPTTSAEHPDTFKVDTQPADPETSARTIDLRKIIERGGV